MEKILLKTDKLSKSFSSGGTLQHVLKNIDLELYKGSFTVIMGASGAGKSTLMYALSGMDKPSLGTITFGDKVISGLTPDQLAIFRRRHCGFVFQQIYMLESMSIMDNVSIPEETQKKFPAQISGGEAQRAGIVRALINSPEILFADEPTGALNSKTGLDVLDTLTKFNGQGQSVVMVTHDIRSARRGDRILYLKDGMILGECLLGKYKHGDEERHRKLSAFLKEMGW